MRGGINESRETAETRENTQFGEKHHLFMQSVLILWNTKPEEVTTPKRLYYHSSSKLGAHYKMNYIKVSLKPQRLSDRQRR